MVIVSEAPPAQTEETDMTFMGSSHAGELTEVRPQSTAELIADQLRNAILHGRISANEQLGEVDLASRFGVSRGPIREALQRLMEEGLLRRARNRGVFVVAFDHSDIADIYATRSAIETAAAEHVLAGSVDDAIAQLTECYELMQKAASAGDAAAQTSADMEFHIRLVEASQSPRLRKIQRTLLIESQICMTELDTRYADPKASVDEHIAIVDALRSGDSDRVRQSIHEHMQTAVTLLTTSNSDE
jgi:DNA-binding GntR family transcriptional regulator